MFLIDDTLESRQKKIRSHEPFVAVILSSIDFEWTVRRGILALGSSPTKHIRDNILNNCSGLEKYKDAWRKEVKYYTGKSLVEVVPNWQYFKEKAYPLRNRLVHGIYGSVSKDYALERLDAILLASKSISDFAEKMGEPIYGRKIVRLKHRKSAQK